MVMVPVLPTVMRVLHDDRVHLEKLETWGRNGGSLKYDLKREQFVVEGDREASEDGLRSVLRRASQRFLQLPEEFKLPTEGQERGDLLLGLKKLGDRLLADIRQIDGCFIGELKVQRECEELQECLEEIQTALTHICQEVLKKLNLQITQEEEETSMQHVFEQIIFLYAVRGQYAIDRVLNRIEMQRESLRGVRWQQRKSKPKQEKLDGEGMRQQQVVKLEEQIAKLKKSLLLKESELQKKSNGDMS